MIMRWHRVDFCQWELFWGWANALAKPLVFFFLFFNIKWKKYLILIGLKDVVGELVKSNDVSKLSSMVSVEFGFLWTLVSLVSIWSSGSSRSSKPFLKISRRLGWLRRLLISIWSSRSLQILKTRGRQSCSWVRQPSFGAIFGNEMAVINRRASLLAPLRHLSLLEIIFSYLRPGSWSHIRAKTLTSVKEFIITGCQERGEQLRMRLGYWYWWQSGEYSEGQ